MHRLFSVTVTEIATGGQWKGILALPGKGRAGKKGSFWTILLKRGEINSTGSELFFDSEKLIILGDPVCP
jgi:hypothetical protein